MTYSQIIAKVSGDINLPPDTVDKTYKAFWKYIRDSIHDLPLKENLTEEEFMTLRPHFNVPSLGKLTCSYKRYISIKKRFENISKLRQLNEST